MKDFHIALTAYVKAFELMNRLRLWRYALLPGLLSIAIGGAIAWLGWQLSHYIAEFALQWIHFKHFATLIQTLVRVLSTAIVFVLSIMSYRNILLALSGPLLSPLASKIYEHETNMLSKDAPFVSVQTARLLIRSVHISLRNLLKELFYTVLVLALGLFAPFLVVVPILLFFIQAYYAGCGSLDYTLERFYTVRQSVDFSQRHRGMAIGNGAVFLGLLAVPILGLFLAPVLATAAATIAAVQRVPMPLLKENHEGLRKDML